MESPEFFMKAALAEAERGRYLTYTNPMVGAVIVKENRIIGLGHHLGFGYEHAEINAFNNMAKQEIVRGATMFVTLEPCSHFGKTPPCCREIVRKGVKEIYIAQADPNLLVAGRGINYLKEHGVEVHIGVAETAARKLNEFYNFFYQNSRPFVTLKIAQTLDGRISLASFQRTYLTDDTVFEDVQKLRADYQAILVGSGTVLADDPLLTVRTRKLKYPPVRIVLDRRGRLTNEYKITNKDAPTWIFTENEKIAERFANSSVKVLFKTEWTLRDIMQHLTRNGIQSLLIEGGAKIQDAFLEASLIQQFVVYQTDQLAGGNSLAAFKSERDVPKLINLKMIARKQVGNALKISLRR
ncbi:bifunctional diaminohydroxyphosphoribosylaminopyrimidine deaminase/5-amino-6-(5-phosphoribosylamino)uracil reductase RibD [Liquorilactobacillus uvarum]|uniref:bifunctional diaminohydroxyphosphoribosylaminopyrimidine deaminase/5-amino-6-(5-phosphoribosylamino)uracil reductase RibD n=1 Tax=Liquorilactobacillus uvarum TaxID=303240 RepID=UPI0035CF1F35